MTLYYTDKKTGAMTPVLAGLKRKPAAVHYNKPPRASRLTYRPSRTYRQPQPLGDLVVGVGCVVLAFVIWVVASPVPL